MNRRRFLSSTMLGGLGLAAAPLPARAFSVNTCSSASDDAACRELAKHQELIARLDSLLAEKGMDASQRKAALASARCPFCGNLLVG